MKNFTNGSVGNLAASSWYNGATVVHSSGSILEFQTSSGGRKVTSLDAFQEFDYLSEGATLKPLFGEGSVIASGSTQWTVLDVSGRLVTLKDSSGSITVTKLNGVYDVLS